MSAPNPTYTVELTENQLRSLKAVAYNGIEELALSPGGTLAPLTAAIVEQSDADTTDIGAILNKSLQERGQ